MNSPSLMILESQQEREFRLDSDPAVIVEDTERMDRQVRRASCPATKDMVAQQRGKQPRVGSCPMMRFGTCTVPHPEISSSVPCLLDGKDADSRMYANGFEVVAEVGRTLREILVQVIFLILLVLRLHSLPLVFLTRTLAVPGSSTDLSTFNLLRFSIERSQQKACCRQLSAISPLLKLSQRIGGCITSFIRTVKTLYLLWQILQEEPNLFSRQYAPASSPQSVIFGARKMKTPIYSIPCVDEESGETTPPPTASQVYHASLGVEGSLDKILASFEDSATTKDSHTEHSENPEVRQSRNALHNEFPSIQTTPEYFKTPKMNPKEESQVPVQEAEIFSRRLSIQSTPSQTQQRSKNGTQETTQKDERGEKGFKIPVPSEGQATWTKAFDVCEHERGPCEIRRCATCASRQSRSQIPKKKSIQAFVRRSLSAESQVQGPLNNTSPRKLQRRVARY